MSMADLAVQPDIAEGPPRKQPDSQPSAIGPVRATAGFGGLDRLIVLGLFAVGVSWVILVTQARGQAITDLSLGVPGRWFESDGTEIMQIMSDPSFANQRIKLHPLFPLIAYPMTRGIMGIGGLPPLRAVFVLNALTAGLWLATLYAIVRLVGCRRPDSLLFTGLAATSGAGMFWFLVPETYPLGSLTILQCFLLVALARHRRVPEWCFVAASAASLSITVTNWMAGLLGSLVTRTPRRAITLSLAALTIVAGLAATQRLVFPRSTGLFLNPKGYLFQTVYVMTEEQGGPLAAGRVIFLTSEVTPRIELSPYPHQQAELGPLLTIQHAPAGSSGPVGQAATILWGLLLAAGALALVAGPADRSFRIALGLMILGETVLHMAYGEETFLYALNYVPLLILAASLATLSRWRYAILTCAALLLPCLAWNNGHQLKDALDRPPQRAAPSTSLDLDSRPGVSIESPTDPR
jgi:hypothetical protein